MGKWKNGENAVRDKADIPVILLYDEDNDKTRMARTSSAGELTVANSSLYWKQFRYEYDSNDNVIYKGYHKTYNAAESDTSYWIVKYTYSNNNLVRKQYAEGSWTNRANLNW